MPALIKNIDILAGVAALLWAAAAMFVPELAELVDPKVAGGFGLAALGRGFNDLRKAKALAPAEA